LQLAARFADRWCTLGSLKSSTAEVARATREMNQALAESARGLGRDPRDIGRAFCVGWTQERPFDSLGAFQGYLGPMIEAGITQFVFGYWHAADAEQSAPVRNIEGEERLEWVARVAIPSLRGLAAA
jgi:hypothetical protein